MTQQAHRGTSREFLVRRIREVNPELAGRYQRGEISAFRAAKLAGIAQPRFTMFGHDPEVLAKAMRRNLPPDVLRAVIERLTPREEA